MNDSELQKLRIVKLVSRISLGLVWLYEGLVPKIFYLQAHSEQIDLVQRSHLALRALWAWIFATICAHIREARRAAS